MLFFKQKKLIEINEKIEKLQQMMENQSHTFQSIEKRLDTLEQAAQKNALDFQNMDIRMDALEQTEEKNVESIHNALKTITDMNADSRQYVCSCLTEKLDQMSLDNGKKIESLKSRLNLQNIENRLNKLEQLEQKNADSVRHALKAVRESDMDSRQYICDCLNEKLEHVLSDNEKKLECLKDILTDQKVKGLSLAESIAENVNRMQDSHGDYAKEIQESLNSIKELINVNTETDNAIIEKLDVVENEIRMLLINSVMDQIPIKQE